MAASDFDFLHGKWNIRNRRLRNPRDASSDDWEAFESTSVCRPVLGGLGNFEEISSTGSGPDGAPFHGITLRLYDPSADRWLIWWAADRQPGVLDDAMVGTFDGRQGAFFGHDDGLDVRFDWYVDPPRWVQSFKRGDTWVENWEMVFDVA